MDGVFRGSYRRKEGTRKSLAKACSDIWQCLERDRQYIRDGSKNAEPHGRRHFALAPKQTDLSHRIKFFRTQNYIYGT